MEKELAHYMKFDGLLPNDEPIAKNENSEAKVEVQCPKSMQSIFKNQILIKFINLIWFICCSQMGKDGIS